MSYIDTLVEQFPVRKNKKQKESFCEWAVNEANSLGYDAKTEWNTGNNNVVVGNPETAATVFTAHYDTPPVMPVPNFITPKNILFYLIYQIGIVLVLLAICLGIGAAVEHFTNSREIGYDVGLLFYWLVLLLMLLGPANKNNVNDNTSGVASVFELMARIPAEQRGKVAFILFDNEEKGMRGSGAYAREHKVVKKEKLIINMDCVGEGENILFFTKKETRALPFYEKLVSAMQAQAGRNLLMNNMEGCIYPSDQSQFKHGIAVCACKKAKIIEYYCDKIHTNKDTVCEQENLDFIANGLAQFVSTL
ncbi:MAG: M28 family peptidase [Oscillospiraceae bacterium]|nr:M28 family peptidase [Oscillospiraceae bacterium]